MSASRNSGVVFTDGSRLYCLETGGAVRGAAFAGRELGKIGNSGGGPIFAAISPDGKWAYVSGPYSNTNPYGYQYDPNFPPGRVYRVPMQGQEKMREFVTIPVQHKEGNGGAWVKACTNTANFTAAKGPVHAVACDAQGNLYVADRERGCVAVFDASGKEIGRVAVKNPHLVAVHPESGAIYVTQFDCLSYSNFQCVLNKFDSYRDDPRPVAKYEFPAGNWVNLSQAMAVAASKTRTVVWMAGVKGGVVPLEDRGDRFEPLAGKFGPQPGLPGDWNRLAVDYDRDEIYISNGTTRIWRYDGSTGAGRRSQEERQGLPGQRFGGRL